MSYLYWDDRRQCKAIKADYLARAKELGDQPLTSGGLGEVRKVKVWAGKWPEDDDTDRGARYFRKYIKVRVCCLSHMTGALRRAMRARLFMFIREPRGAWPQPAEKDAGLIHSHT